MSDTAKLGLLDAARRLGVSVGVLRRAIRAGRVPSPPHLTATAELPAEWLESVQAAVEASPNALSSAARQLVPPFARYKGTSAWRKYRGRVREFNQFHAAASRPDTTSAVSG